MYMYTPTLLTLLSLTSLTLSTPTPLSTRQSPPCFIIGSTSLPAETQDIVTALQSTITCDTSTATLSGVPDVSSGGISFSSINFASSGQQPLAFATSAFETADPLASSDLTRFQNQLNVYQATEAGIRSVAGGLPIKAPKFFLAFQIARIKTAQGIAITDPGQTVEHLLGKVVKNAGSGESQGTKDGIMALAGVLS